ncbi:D-alanyl-D-alanine carboxypeptidase, partial [bacterium]|nr:D-alanyl-D-alanine carboxypeptidase [bacterium]
DKTPYPNTWLKEDEWPNYGMVTPYIIDSNLIQISINRSSLSKKVDVISNSEYKIPIINELEIGEKNNFQILRLYGEDSSIINLKGEISQDEQLNLFVLKPELNFNIKLNSALEKNGIIHNEKAEVKIVPSNAKKIASIERPIRDIARLVLHNSCNIESEVIFKVAASKYYDKTASLDDAIKMFMEFHGNKFGKNEKIVDASGVSRENKISLKTLNAILFDLYKKTDLITLLPTADEGTLSERLVFLKGNLKAKTGTLKKYSSLNGVLTTRNNNKVIFSIAVQNSDKRKSLLKNFENTLVGIIYKNY